MYDTIYVLESQACKYIARDINVLSKINKKGDYVMKEQLSKLLKVKSLVTMISVIVFAILSLTDRIAPELFMSVFTTIIAFYFGTQHEKRIEQEK